jgi:ABC-type branched-subunit amino acid transport system substrate-binding protein
MWLWTGFTAPYPPFASQRAVSDYVAAIRSVSGSADTANQFMQGAYVGMEVLVEALRKVGPQLTRAKLKQAMDSMRFDNGLTKTLSWRAGGHFANTAMQGFTIQYSQGFNGFRYEQTGWVEDPWWNKDHP